MEILWWTLIILLFMIGYAGLIVPLLPGAPLQFIGFLIYHFAIDNQVLGPTFWIGAVLLNIIIIAVDYLAGGIATRAYGGSRYASWAAIAGALIFPFLMTPLIGLIVGPFIAVFIVELFQRKGWKEALKASFGSFVGFIGGIVAKGLLMTALIGWFIILIFI